ncbi:uncharacterized protein DS421_10g316810 [Arachis hypogaea]|nr:uncharacterized protein DS421_10g316810 [Arachis hypogaea]
MVMFLFLRTLSLVLSLPFELLFPETQRWQRRRSSLATGSPSAKTDLMTMRLTASLSSSWVLLLLGDYDDGTAKC